MQRPACSQQHYAYNSEIHHYAGCYVSRRRALRSLTPSWHFVQAVLPDAPSLSRQNWYDSGPSTGSVDPEQAATAGVFEGTNKARTPLPVQLVS